MPTFPVNMLPYISKGLCRHSKGPGGEEIIQDYPVGTTLKAVDLSWSERWDRRRRDPQKQKELSPPWLTVKMDSQWHELKKMGCLVQLRTALG